MGAANSFFGTKVILKGDLPEVEMYKKKMDFADVQLAQGVSMMSSYIVHVPWLRSCSRQSG